MTDSGALAQSRHRYARSQPHTSGFVGNKINALRNELRVPLYRNAYALMLNTGVNSVFGAAYWVLAAHYFPAHEVGRDNALISLMLLVSTLTQLNFGQALIRFLPRAGTSNRRLLLSAYGISSVNTAAVSLGVVAICHFVLKPTSALYVSSAFGLWFVIATVGWSIFNLEDAALTGLRRAIWIPLENGVFGLVKLALLVAIASSAVGHELFISWTAPLVVFLVAVNLLIFRSILSKHAKETAVHQWVPTRSELARYMAGDYTGQIFTQLSSTFLPILVVGLLGSAQGAYLVPAQTIWLAMNMLSLAITSALVVEAATDESKAQQHARAVLRRICMLVLPCALLAAAFAPWLLSVFGSDYRNNATHLLQLLMLSTFPRVLVSLYTTMLRLHRRTGRLALTMAVQAAILIGGTVLLAGSAGLTAVGWAALASQALPAAFLGPRVVNWLWPNRPPFLAPPGAHWK